MRRLARLATITLAAASGLVVIAAPPAGAVDVATVEQFIDAWIDEDETAINVTASITFDCDDFTFVRDSATPITVTGANPGITLTQGCEEGSAGYQLLESWGTGSVTVIDLHLHSSGGFTASAIYANGDVIATNVVITDLSDGIFSGGDITVTGSSISGTNTAIEASSSNTTITVTSSELSDNDGHGIRSFSEVFVDVVDSEINRNADGGIEIMGHDVTVTNSEINDNGGDGIRTYGDVTVTNSGVNENEGHGIDAEGEVTVTNSEINDNEGPGISTNEDVRVTNESEVDRNDDIGLFTWNGDVTVTDSSVSGNATHGIGIGDGDTTITVTGSAVDGNGGRGINAIPDGFEPEGQIVVDVTDSSVSENTEDGILGSGPTEVSHNVSVVDSTVSHNTGYGIRVANGSTPTAAFTLSGSDVSDNAGYGVTITNTPTEITGSSVNRNGLGGVTCGIAGSSPHVADTEFIGNGGSGFGCETNLVTAERIVAIGNVGTGFGSDGALQISDSLLADNLRGAYMGWVDSFVVNTTVTDNDVGLYVAASGVVAVTYATITDNDIGIEVLGDVEVFGTVLADNDDNCTAVVEDSAYTWADDATCGLSGTGDVTDPAGDPQLGALEDNGGPTETQLPAFTSPLAGAIPGGDCAPGITTDQRGEPRPSPAGTCTIGAVEVDGTPPPPPPGSPAALSLNAGSVPAGGQVVATGTGFEDGSTTTFTLFSDPVDLGEATADGDGSFEAALTIPLDTDVGSHTVRAEGTDANGDAVVLEVALEITTATGAGGDGGGSGDGPRDGSLAFTGAGLGTLLAYALVALAFGATALAGRRRQSLSGDV